MAEYSANAVQTVNPGEAIVFTNSDFPCQRGLVRHRDGTGSFLLAGWVPNRCCCDKSAQYYVNFGANIAVPTGGTVGEISVAVPVWRGCCETVSIRNLGDQPILVDSPVVSISRPDLAVTR